MKAGVSRGTVKAGESNETVKAIKQRKQGSSESWGKVQAWESRGIEKAEETIIQ